MTPTEPDAPPGWQPRLSLLNALLLMALVALSIVIVMLWREVGPLRAEVKQLRDETGQLYVEDPSKLCAIRINTTDELTWKWRVWVPENRKLVVYLADKEIPRAGFPASDANMTLESGEQLIEFRIQRDPRNGKWYGNLHHHTAHGSTTLGKYEQPWVDWPNQSSMTEGGSRHTIVERPGEPFLLMRYRASQTRNFNQSANSLAGFMIWIDQQK